MIVFGAALVIKCRSEKEERKERKGELFSPFFFGM